MLNKYIKKALAALAVQSEVVIEIKPPQERLEQMDQTVTPAANVVAAPEAKASVDAPTLVSLQEALTAALSKMADQEKLLAIADNAQKELVAQALATKITSRKNTIVAAVGTESAEAVLSATTVLDDTQFGIVIGAMAKSLVVEASTPAFQEVGHGAQAELPKVVDEANPEESSTGKAVKKMMAETAARSNLI